MKARVVVQAGVRGETQELHVGPGEAVLIGRDPEAQKLKPETAPAAMTAEPVVIHSPSVSANHALMWNQDGVTSFVDVGSKNGTWLRLPPGDAVAVRSQQELVLQLSAPSTSEPRDEVLADAEWSNREDYGEGIVRVVAEWLRQRNVPARITLIPRKPGERVLDSVGQIPLANDSELRVIPVKTMDTSWEQILAVLWRYTTRQNLLFTAEEETRAEGLILASPAMRQAHRQVVEAAQRGVRCLLIGPSGSGKDGLARCYHRHSARNGPFVARNCSMFSRELLRSELFGAEEGAFTGAVRRIVGAIERAHGGTLFLDEIGEMESEVQPMLLTFLDRGEFERMGAYGATKHADVRIVSATNRDLRTAAQKGEFRQDLWYRLAGEVVDVPSLRERPADVEAYLKLRRLRSGVSAHGALSAAARERIVAHAWTGNFRELAAFAEKLPQDAGAEQIDEGACVRVLQQVALTPQPAPPRSDASAPGALDLAAAAQVAAAAFDEDAGHAVATWDDVKEFVEKYLKPVVFSQLTGPLGDPPDVSALAGALGADRGTVSKQLSRYLERFVHMRSR